MCLVYSEEKIIKRLYPLRVLKKQQLLFILIICKPRTRVNQDHRGTSLIRGTRSQSRPHIADVPIRFLNTLLVSITPGSQRQYDH